MVWTSLQTQFDNLVTESGFRKRDILGNNKTEALDEARAHIACELYDGTDYTGNMVCEVMGMSKAILRKFLKAGRDSSDLLEASKLTMEVK